MNLTKIHQIRKFLRNAASLTFHKSAAEQVVTPELLEKYRQQDMEAGNTIAREILKHVHGAMKHFGIMENAPPQEWKDFRDATVKHLWESRMPVYDPTKSAFNTFVFNHVNNMWKNWIKTKSTKPLDQGPSLDEPLGPDGGTGADLLKDPLALDFKSEVEAEIIETALLENIRNPKHQEILGLWLGEDPRMGPKERAKEVAEKYNKAHPEDPPIQDYRMYRIMRDLIFPTVLDQFPELARSVDFMPNPDTSPGMDKWIRKPKPEEPAAVAVEDLDNEDDELYVPRADQPAPVYRIDPETGERTQISLNMRRRQITATQEAWCHNLMTFLSIERHGKSRRTIKSSATR